MRKCKNAACRTRFVPPQPWIRHCSDDCGVVLGLMAIEKKKEAEARQKRRAEKAQRIADKAALEKHKPLAYFEKIAERHCNAYIRARDPDVCISCGVTHSSAWQAGHFISVGSNSTLRYNEDNIHKQCVQCNLFKGSNATQYRIGLVAKIGIERVEALEAWHSPIKVTAEFCKEIAEMYKSKLKALLAEKSANSSPISA